jgi:tRNA A-37 threonylcarbamoyl transferase component Bud32
MRILLVHDSGEARARLVQTFIKALPDVVVEMWDPARRGLPPMTTDWKRFELVFIDGQPPVATLLAWLRATRAARAPGVPPLIVVGPPAIPNRVREIEDAGAFAYADKNQLTAEAVQKLSRSALRTPVRIPTGPGPRLRPVEDIASVGQPAGAAVSNLPPGYRVLRKIADGGMSKVYLAERVTDGTVLVLKMIDPRLHQDPSFRQRFVREYKLLARISNEHVVAILDQGMTDSYGYIATEYFAGGDLKARIRPGGLPRQEVLAALEQIGAALDAVHSAGIVHRDLKPQNIMYRDDSRLALVDFGLAREMDGSATLTQKGVVFATPLYMSPEQCLGNTIDGRSDLYSVGVLIYEMLTGRPPYLGRTPPELAYHHVHSPIPKLPARVLSLQPLIERLLAKDPANRFPTAQAMLEFVERQ